MDKKALKFVIIGSGGHSGVVLDALSRVKVDILGLIDDFQPVGCISHGFPIIGKVKDMPELEVTHYFIAVGDNKGRKKIREQVAKLCPDAVPVPVCDISVLGKFAIGGGTFLAQGTCIGNNTKIGEFSIINTRASVDHDCVIGDYVHLAPGVVTGGHVTIGDNTFVGIGAMIRDHITIGCNCTIGMGSVVVNDVPNNVKGWGNPWKSQDTK